MLVLLQYSDYLGRRTRLGVDEDAWVRQEMRDGGWQTMERHPVDDLETLFETDAPDRTPPTAGGL